MKINMLFIYLNKINYILANSGQIIDNSVYYYPNIYMYEK